MVVSVQCPNCHSTFRVHDQDVGRSANCKKCGQRFTVAIDADPTSAPRSNNACAPPTLIKLPEQEPGKGNLDPTLAAIPAFKFQRIGRYEIRGKLGEGAMGEVWLGHDANLKRDLAVKTLRQEYASDDDYLRRFLHEARAAAKLHHTNTVTIYEVAADERIAYIAMELVDGRSLDKVLAAKRSLNWQQATSVVRDAAAGLAAAHALGIIHRDVKPANLILTNSGITKVVDFGLARAHGPDAFRTKSGVLLGTPAYMPPEQWAGEAVDARSDVYGLICTYYHLLTGSPPFEAADVLSLGLMHQRSVSPVPSERLPNLPQAIDSIVARGLSKNRNDRHQSASELIADLDKALAQCHDSDAGEIAVAPGAQSTSTLDSRTAASGLAGRLQRIPRWTWIASACVATLVIVGIILGFSASSGRRDSAVNRSTPEAPDPSASSSSVTATAAKSYGLRFDGRRSRVIIPRSNFKAFGDHSLTIEAIVIPTSSASRHIVIADLAGSSGFALGLRGGPEDPKWTMGYRGSKTLLVPNDAPVILNKRVHIATVFDKDRGALKLFVDGRLNNAVGFVRGGFRSSPWDTIIGADPDNPGNNFKDHFQGIIEQIRISKTARYIDDYQAPSTLEKDESTLLLYLFDEGEGNIVHDASGRGCDARIRGAEWVKVKS